MKRHLLFLGFACLFISVFGNNIITPHYDIPPDLTPIELQGRLDLSYSLDDVEAGANENYVYIYFHRSFGDVGITLYNPTGVIVYSNVINTSIQQTVIIPITGTIEGVYTLVLENANGYAEGDFEQNNN